MRWLALLALLATPAQAQDKLTVAAVNAPLAYFAERLGGDAVEVLYPVPEGEDAALWRPPVRVISLIQQADVILLNGAEFAKWTTKTSLPRSRIADTSAAFADTYIETAQGVTHSHGNDGEHSHTGIVSTTWLDFAQAAQQAEAAAEAMIRKAPAQEGAITTARKALVADLTALDTRARAIGQKLAGRPILATHPGYDYFARAYGLTLTDPEPTEGAIALWPSPEADATRFSQAGVTNVLFPLADSAPGDFIAIMTEALDALEAAAK